MYKRTLLIFCIGIGIGASIGFATGNLAVGMGVGAALGLIFARRRRQ